MLGSPAEITIVAMGDTVETIEDNIFGKLSSLLDMGKRWQERRGQMGMFFELDQRDRDSDTWEYAKISLDTLFRRGSVLGFRMVRADVDCIVRTCEKGGIDSEIFDEIKKRSETQR